VEFLQAVTLCMKGTSEQVRRCGVHEGVMPVGCRRTSTFPLGHAVLAVSIVVFVCHSLCLLVHPGQ
jgi:hypothetical protein